MYWNGSVIRDRNIKLNKLGITYLSARFSIGRGRNNVK